MKLEVVVIPVSDVDRAKEFYGSLGRRLDGDFAAGSDWRGIQFTPPGSGCSIIFGKDLTTAAPGSWLLQEVTTRAPVASAPLRRRSRQRTMLQAQRCEPRPLTVEHEKRIGLDGAIRIRP